MAYLSCVAKLCTTIELNSQAHRFYFLTLKTTTPLRHCKLIKSMLHIPLLTILGIHQQVPNGHQYHHLCRLPPGVFLVLGTPAPTRHVEHTHTGVFYMSCVSATSLDLLNAKDMPEWACLWLRTLPFHQDTLYGLVLHVW